MVGDAGRKLGEDGPGDGVEGGGRDGEFSPAGTTRHVRVRRVEVDGSGATEVTDIGDEVAVEESFTLVVGEKLTLNLVASPADLRELALGFLYTEGLIAGASDVAGVEVKPPFILVELREETPAFRRELEVRTTGCLGVREQWRTVEARVEADWTVRPGVIFGCQEELHRRNVTWRRTGGCHASGVFSRSGELLSWAEDVGRHTTLDKAIGGALLAGVDFGETLCVTSGRLAAAMVAKVARAGIPLLVSNTAPLDKGIEVARRARVTLVGFARGRRMTVYSRPDRIAG
ncbi:MAG: formate dehydrogenase accessory sulfurtransferase FdhD [Promethearchaeota archaeon]